MTTPGVSTPYSTLAQLFTVLPSWVPLAEQERIASYQIYEDLYWNNPDSVRLTVRDTDGEPIYVPAARTIVDTLNRYVGTGLDFQVDPLFGSPASQALAQQAFTDLFRREAFKSEFQGNKRFGLVRGVWIWHVFADPRKPAGSRISVKAVDPGSWFPVYDDDDPQRLRRVHLAEQYVTEGGDLRVKRLTYEYIDNANPALPRAIQVSEGIFEMEDWNLRLDAETVTIPPTILPVQIPAIPVYPIRNGNEPGNPYGSSALRGFERIMAAISQSVTDEEITLALMGLGIYATDGGSPIDEDGEETDWVISPGTVLENANGFKRVDGVTSVQPYGDHVDRLERFLKEASATPDAAIGKVDAAIAESGIALRLQLGPMLAKAEEADQEIVDKHTQLFHDLRFWLQVYEGIQIADCVVLPVLGEKIPPNKKEIIEETLLLVDAGLMSRATARRRLAAVGILFDPKEDALIQAEQAAVEPVDPEGDRAAVEADPSVPPAEVPEP